MSSKSKEIDAFAKSTLGETPKVIGLLEILNEKSAEEQFRENTSLYLGRTATPRKVLALMAMSVSLANMQKDSAMLHYKLSKRFGAINEEILDAIKISKMASMSSTLSPLQSMLPLISLYTKTSPDRKEVEQVLKNVADNAGLSKPPENIITLSKISFELLNEHLKEKAILLTSQKLERKYVYMIALSVSISLRDVDCANTYLEQFFKSGGTLPELEDAIAVTRFVSGNKVLTGGIDILTDMAANRE
ncbi:MAG: hypothetical protein QXI38_04995 [Conexivisphaerales archaeon]